MLMISSLFKRSIFLAALSMQTVSTAAQSLTIAQALETPSLPTIEKSFTARGGIYTDAIGKQIQLLIQEILRGKSFYKDDHREPSCDQRSDLHETLGNLGLISGRLPSINIPYTHLAQQLVVACQKAYLSIDCQKKEISQQNDDLARDPVLRTAHYFALITVVQLLFIIFSPRTQPYERMHALYLFNTVQLLGDRGILLRRFRARLNRFYFTYEGILRSYDPSAESGHTAKHVKALAEFLNRLATSQKQALILFARGMSAGIPLMESCYEQVKREGWNRSNIKFGWRFAAALFKEITALDVIEMRTIEPQRIFSHKANRDFFALMSLCLRAQMDPDQRENLVAQAEEICELHRSVSNYHYNLMKKYVQSIQQVLSYQITS